MPGKPTADDRPDLDADCAEHAGRSDRPGPGEERLRRLTDNLPGAATYQLLREPDGRMRFLYVSRGIERLHGVPAEAVLADAAVLFDQLPPEYRRAVAEGEHESVRTMKPFRGEFPALLPTGETRWFKMVSAPRPADEGGVIWDGVEIDITARKLVEAERERLLEREREARAESERRREELERVTESRTRLMRGFSHDVKNPLGAADGYAALLEEGVLGELSEKQLESVRRIRRSIGSSLRLIHDLLEVARAEAGQVVIEPVETDVAGIAREIAEDFRAQAEAAGSRLGIRASEPLPATTDPSRVAQVLANLLSNAVKYAPGGQLTVTARRRSDGDGPRPGEWIAVEVCDTGPGIPPERREQVFQEFTRLDPDAQQGAGVGLAISRRIARLLGGEITLTSEVGRGSAFTLWLPRVAGE
ncbi:MAG TPA: PAS domain-containing sensor histidine kinase [Longimicrobiaceae bacterium]|nr:PAS domain-containing sensor histidine kinase [Longimicrobiaceae bacterium]